MIAGCEFCQHPACWLYDVNNPNKATANSTLNFTKQEKPCLNQANISDQLISGIFL